MFMSSGTLLLALLALPFAGSLAAALFPANARNREAWLAGAVALAVHGLAWTVYPEMANGQVLRLDVAWLPAFGLNFTMRLDGFAWIYARYLRDAILGTTAERLLGKCRRPALVVKRPPRRRGRRNRRRIPPSALT